MKILEPKDAREPQMLVTTVGTNLHLFVYTGAVFVGHFAGHNPSNEDVLFPLVFLSPPSAELAIQPLGDEREFLAAVVHASISGFVDKTDPTIVHVLSARAELRRVRLHPNTPILAVVLSAKIKAQNAEFHDMGYQVTVLQRAAEIPNHIKVGSATWDGKYATIGPIVRPGAPQQP
jgi:hypothetical protein